MSEFPKLSDLAEVFLNLKMVAETLRLLRNQRLDESNEDLSMKIDRFLDEERLIYERESSSKEYAQALNARILSTALDIWEQVKGEGPWHKYLARIEEFQGGPISRFSPNNENIQISYRNVYTGQNRYIERA